MDNKMRGFELFLIAGSGNPSNVFVPLLEDGPEDWEMNPPFPVWAAEFVAIQERGLPWERILKWALIEDLSHASHQRASLPESVNTTTLRGSGRWGCWDEGGHWKLLKEGTIAWGNLDPHVRKKWDQMAEYSHDVKEKLRKWVEKYASRTRRERQKKYQVNQVINDLIHASRTAKDGGNPIITETVERYLGEFKSAQDSGRLEMVDNWLSQYGELEINSTTNEETGKTRWFYRENYMLEPEI